MRLTVTTPLAIIADAERCRASARRGRDRRVRHLAGPCRFPDGALCIGGDLARPGGRRASRGRARRHARSARRRDDHDRDAGSHRQRRSASP